MLQFLFICGQSTWIPVQMIPFPSVSLSHIYMRCDLPPHICTHFYHCQIHNCLDHLGRFCPLLSSPECLESRFIRILRSLSFRRPADIYSGLKQQTWDQLGIEVWISWVTLNCCSQLMLEQLLKLQGFSREGIFFTWHPEYSPSGFLFQWSCYWFYFYSYSHWSSWIYCPGSSLHCS